MSNLELVSAKGIFPIGRLETLVRLATGSKDCAADWNAYVDQIGYGFPNEGEFRLFPLVADTTKPEAIDRRRIWIATEETAAKAAHARNLSVILAVSELMETAGIAGRWTKGTALAATVYEQPVHRPSGDVDLLVRLADVAGLVDHLSNAGWVIVHGAIPNNQAHALSGHAITMSHKDGGTLDIGWLPRMSFAYDPWLIENIMQGTETVEDASSTWLFIEAIDHGLSANRVWPIRWVVDAVKLLQQPGRIDFGFIFEVAKRYHMELILLTGLQTLARFSDAIPESLLEDLRNAKRSSLQDDELAARLQIDTPFENFVVSRRYNLAIRGSTRHHRIFPQSPYDMMPGQSSRLRMCSAYHNIRSRVRYPLGLFSQEQHFGHRPSV